MVRGGGDGQAEVQILGLERQPGTGERVRAVRSILRTGKGLLTKMEVQSSLD